MALIDKAKVALRIKTNAFDEEITDLIEAAKLDLGLAGIEQTADTDPLIMRAVIIYVRLNFGQPDDYDRLKAAYDEQKKQLSMATGYTNWEVS
ncbi:DNA-packaging protein [Pseudoramibacter alactolyticus]|uniref:phage head-tail connector protein n=1 Tax=Pseudoramibacter alactolyticus TaxID=113287 RepID=UPI0028E78C41|nr:DNA-packaging protein [Pseudoramibacter alactolyticus]